MKNLNELDLCKKSKKQVEEWLQEWLDLFIQQANGKQGWPYRADFENEDIFYFTDCKDILEKDPEAKGQEHNRAIRTRKRKVLLQLFIKTLMGKENICDDIKCGHCGFKPCWIEALGDGTGHWTYCPKCKKLEVQVFPDGFDNCINTIKKEITKMENKPLRFSDTIKIDPFCKELIEEIKAYKYEHGAHIETHANPRTRIEYGHVKTNPNDPKVWKGKKPISVCKCENCKTILHSFSTPEAERDYKKFKRAMGKINGNPHNNKRGI